MQLVTHQTGPDGQKVRRLYVEQGLDIARELYLGAVVDRDRRRIAFMASTEGGVEIEKVAEETPEKILTVHVDPAVGFAAYQARELAFGLGLGAKETLAQVREARSALSTRSSSREDCSLCEINPLVVTESGDVVALDAQDHPRRQRRVPPPRVATSSRTRTRKTPSSSRRRPRGSTTCRSTATSAAWSTAPAWRWPRWTSSSTSVRATAWRPANFLDVGGGADQEQVTKAFKMILKSPKVKAIFVNIFGGIMKCDVIANGVVAAAKELGLKVPLVVRLEGTNVELGPQDPERERARDPGGVHDGRRRAEGRRRGAGVTGAR